MCQQKVRRAWRGKHVKNFLYHYTCLALATVQAFLWAVFFWLLFGYQGVVIAPLIIIGVVQLLITAFADAKLRRFSGNLVMILIAFLFSPLRFAFEIVTVVRMHMRGLNSNFAKRGNWHYTFTSKLLYALFGTDDMGRTTRALPYDRAKHTLARAEADATKKEAKRKADILQWATRDEETGEVTYYKEKSFIHRLSLNLLTLIIAAGQAALFYLGFALLFLEDSFSMAPALKTLLGILSLGGVFLLTVADGRFRGLSGLAFWASLIFSPVRVFFQTITVIAVVVTLFTRHRRFADMKYASNYPVTCIVYALTSICYLTPAAKARKPADDKQRKEELRARWRAEDAAREARREAERRLRGS